LALGELMLHVPFTLFLVVVDNGRRAEGECDGNGGGQQ